MLKTTIIGYPRIGSQRELKFWIERYFRGKLSAVELEQNAAELRQGQWLLQKQSGLDWFTSNDFSFYDGMLDTAYLLNAIPQAYKVLGLSELDTYFAMARGYQGPEGDVKALAMRKWFNTNYHYLVPVLDDDTELRLNGSKPFDQYEEALSIGVRSRPVVVGPFTFLKLADYQGERTAADYVPELLAAYKEILARFEGLGVLAVQLDEPALVTDLSAEDVALFTALYSELLAAKGGVHILLQTYFGDIRDVYEQAIALPFDGFGLDFIEGKKTLELIRSYGFPEGAHLFAGVVYGKNIWRNNYAQTLCLLQELSKLAPQENIVLSSSCSLLHVPYTLENEPALDDRYKQQFAFAQEKLTELVELAELADDPDYTSSAKYLANVSLIQSRQQRDDPQMHAQITALTRDDFTRKPAFAEREALQYEALGLPLLPTTTIGSFPQTAEVKGLRRQLHKGEITPEEYEAGIRRKIAECIALQEEIGLDVLVHGEFERNDMVEFFGENLDGYLFTEKAWVQSYGTRCVKPPIIWGDVRRNKPITVDYIAYAQSLTERPVKGMLTGPVTILNWSFPREDISHREMALQIALAIKEEVADLEAAGIRVIQIDEAALKEKLPLRQADWRCDYLDWAIPAFRLVHASVTPTTQIHTHMCYSEFGTIIKDIDAMDADVISFEAARSNLSIVDDLKAADFRTEVGPGVYDIHSPRVPSQQEIEAALSTMLGKIDSYKLWVNPDCGLKTRGEAETVPSLENMVAAAKHLREML